MIALAPFPQLYGQEENDERYEGSGSSTRKMLLAPHHGWLNMVKSDCRAGAENFLVTGDEMLVEVLLLWR
jgi:hypothetical protein